MFDTEPLPWPDFWKVMGWVVGVSSWKNYGGVPVTIEGHLIQTWTRPVGHLTSGLHRNDEARVKYGGGRGDVNNTILSACSAISIAQLDPKPERSLLLLPSAYFRAKLATYLNTILGGVGVQTSFGFILGLLVRDWSRQDALPTRNLDAITTPPTVDIDKAILSSHHHQR
jgi:hypothetical protein